ncbi:MAG TPA: hypothetical protein VIS71_11295 [Terrimicrobium sp.]
MTGVVVSVLLSIYDDRDQDLHRRQRTAQPAPQQEAQHVRKIIAALQMSVDGFEGPHGELDWAMADDEETWRDIFEMLESVDTCLLSHVMYPDYEQYRLAVLANPSGILPLRGKAPTGEVTDMPKSIATMAAPSIFGLRPTGAAHLPISALLSE